MKRYLDYRATANTLTEDTSRLHIVINGMGVQLSEMKNKFTQANNSADMWRKASLGAETALSGSLDINLKLQKDFDKEHRQKINWRKIAIGGIVYFVASVVGVVGYVYLFR